MSSFLKLVQHKNRQPSYLSFASWMLAFCLVQLKSILFNLLCVCVFVCVCMCVFYLVFWKKTNSECWQSTLLKICVCVYVCVWKILLLCDNVIEGCLGIVCRIGAVNISVIIHQQHTPDTDKVNLASKQFTWKAFFFFWRRIYVHK